MVYQSPFLACRVVVLFQHHRGQCYISPIRPSPMSYFFSSTSHYTSEHNRRSLCTSASCTMSHARAGPCRPSKQNSDSLSITFRFSWRISSWTCVGRPYFLVPRGCSEPTSRKLITLRKRVCPFAASGISIYIADSSPDQPCNRNNATGMHVSSRDHIMLVLRRFGFGARHACF
jgi:hypothetical protein